MRHPNKAANPCSRPSNTPWKGTSSTRGAAGQGLEALAVVAQLPLTADQQRQVRIQVPALKMLVRVLQMSIGLTKFEPTLTYVWYCPECMHVYRGISGLHRKA